MIVSSKLRIDLQPGVEEAKKLACASLGRGGYAELAAGLEAVSGPDSRYVFPR